MSLSVKGTDTLMTATENAAEILAVAEGAVLTVRHAGGPAYHDTIRVGPELTRLDLVSKAKFLVNRIPFTFGLALTFNARMRDVPWMLLLVYAAWGVQELVLAHSLVVPQQGETGATGAVFVAATVLAFGAGVLELFPSLPPRGVTILAGFFALTVGAVALRGLTSLAGSPTVTAFNDIRDATAETVGLTLGLIAGVVPAAAIAAFRRRSGRASPAG